MGSAVQHQGSFAYAQESGIEVPKRSIWAVPTRKDFDLLISRIAFTGFKSIIYG
jgi:hypothetical protein